MSKTTIHDVARLAAVSIKTVSRVINKERGVRPATMEKVEQAIRQLNYKPNTAARNLAGTQSYAIGYVYDNPNAYYVIGMQNGILAECQETGFELIIHPCDAASLQVVDELLAMLQRSQLAGLVLSPPLSEMPDVTSKLDELGISYVSIVSGQGVSECAKPCVIVHDRQAAAHITTHLLTAGHKRIGFICGDAGHHSTDERLQGYKDTLAEHGLALDENLILPGRYAFDSGVQGAKQLLSLAEPPTAIFGCNDEIAAGCLFAARLMGLSVPEQLAIAGFEDSPFSRQTWPKLTTAAQPIDLIARKATATLIRYILARRQRQPLQGESWHQHFEPELVIRESTQASENG